MSFEDLGDIRVGDEICLDLRELWEDKFDCSQDEQLGLAFEGYLQPSSGEDDECPWEDPYLDIMTDEGLVACDGEVCVVLDVDADAERIALQSSDYDKPFELDFDDAKHCVRLI